MIRLHLQPEPQDFDTLVRVPGETFLKKHPNPTTRQWKSRAYWRRILPDLHNAYKGICAYSCHWIPYDTGHDTVEHFQPKAVVPTQAYEWNNYRLVCGTLNGRKGTDNVLDPFGIQDGWFILDFPSLLVKPGQNLTTSIRQEILQTIERLGLNDEGTCLRARARYVKCFCTGVFPFQHLIEEAPFIAREIQRQNLRNSLAAMMEY
jgi:hypothetical protein